MAITTYAELQTAVGNWLDRSDLTARIPEFIALVEPSIRRIARDLVGRTTGNLTVSSDQLTLPVGTKQVVSLALDEDTYKMPIRPVSPIQLATLARSGTGRPSAYTVIDGVAYFDVASDDDYAYVLVYVRGFTALSDANTTNSILTSSPDIYLYGSLLQAAPYLEHDERVPLWQSAFEKAIAEENIYRERADAPNAIEGDLPVTFGADDGY